MPATPRKPRATAAAKAAAAAAAALAARPFAVDSTAPFAARTEADRLAVAEAIRDAKLAGASGNEMRETFGERLTGPARRRVLRDAGFGNAQTIARSYSAYADGEARKGSRHAREHGSLAAARLAEAREAAAAELAAARKAPKGRSKASKAAHAALVAECESRVASLA